MTATTQTKTAPKMDRCEAAIAFLRAVENLFAIHPDIDCRTAVKAMDGCSFMASLDDRTAMGLAVSMHPGLR